MGEYLVVSADTMVSFLEQCRDAEDTEARIASVRALGAFDEPSQDMVAALIGCLAGHEPEVRAEAAAVLARQPFREGRCAVALAKRLDDPVGRVRDAALAALKSYGEAAADAAPLLMAALKHSDPHIRRGALAILGSLVQHCGGIVSAIRLAFSACMEDENPEVRAEARRALRALMCHDWRADRARAGIE